MLLDVPLDAPVPEEPVREPMPVFDDGDELEVPIPFDEAFPLLMPPLDGCDELDVPMPLDEPVPEVVPPFPLDAPPDDVLDPPPCTPSAESVWASSSPVACNPCACWN